MKKWAVISRMSTINLVIMALFCSSFLIGLAYHDDILVLLKGFGIPFLLSLLFYLPFLSHAGNMKGSPRKVRYRMVMIVFIYMVLIGSLPFMMVLETLVPSLFESMAGFTTTGLTSIATDDYMDVGHSMMFYRCAIQWVGGGFYLIVAFMVISDITDIGRRTMEMDIFSRLGLRLRLSTLIVNIAIVYVLLSLLAMIAFRVGGQSVFDSICLSLGTVSTGGLYSQGREVMGGIGIKMLVVAFMFLSGMGFQAHLSLLSARGRSKAFFRRENVTYILMSVMVPIVALMILYSSGFSLGVSIWRGTFAVISSMTTTGFMVDGMEDWPDSMGYLLLLLMFIGGSTMSLASGLKIRRAHLLVTGFIADVKRSAHPRAILPMSRGEEPFSEMALGSANIHFFYLILILGATILISLIFEGDIFSTISLCVTSITNSGMAFGKFSGIEGIASLDPIMKAVLMIAMFLGRFEILLPLYLVSPRSYTFSG